MTPVEAGVLPVVVASAVVLGGMGLAFALVARGLSRKVARLEAAAAAAPPPPFDPYRQPPYAPPASSPTELAFLWYALSVFFWPAALGLGIYFLRDAKTARMGKNCLFCGMGVFGVVGLLTCAGMVVGSLVVARGAPEPAATASAAVADPYRAGSVGEPVRAGDLVMTVHDVDAAFAPEWPRPALAGGHFVALDVELRNAGAGVVTVIGPQLQLFDDEGHVVRAVFGAKQPTLEGTSLTPGKRVRGWVVFELARGAHADRLQLTVAGRRAPSVAEVAL